MSFRSGFITLLGRPNSGKSTLLNALIGAKVAIVSSKPQTTRTRLQGVLTRESAQLIFVDTPGAHQPGSRLSREMMSAVYQALEGVDLVYLVIDATRQFGTEDELALELTRKSGTKSFLIVNKIDLIAKERMLPLIDHYRHQHAFAEFLPISALTGENLPLLEQKTIEHIAEGPLYFPPDTLTDQPERFLAAEIVREKIFVETRQEVPYATAVVVDAFEEGDRLARIHATVFVERPGHKGIVLGAQGQRIKKIGTEAREELEKLLGRRVHLELFVKTRADWREQPGVRGLIDWRHDE